jgi:hypothetical protein
MYRVQIGKTLSARLFWAPKSSDEGKLNVLWRTILDLPLSLSEFNFLCLPLHTIQLRVGNVCVVTLACYWTLYNSGKKSIVIPHVWEHDRSLGHSIRWYHICLQFSPFIKLKKICMTSFIKLKFIKLQNHILYKVTRSTDEFIYTVPFYQEARRSRYSDWLRAGKPMGRSSSPGRLKNFLFSTSSRPALGSTQPPTKWVPGLFLRG